VVAEFFGARAGIGFMILASAQTFEFLKWLEVRLAPWRVSADAGD
jgi:hypothetical protein